MKKKFLIVIGLILVALIGTLILKVRQPDTIWQQNAKHFNNSFKVISGNATIDDLSGFTTFEWDTIYSFAPYTPEEIIYETVGYHWDNITETVNEGMNQIVFLKDGKVVCYIDGYPEKYKVFFYFSNYENNYVKLTLSDKLAFDMIDSDNGIRYFYYKE